MDPSNKIVQGFWSGPLTTMERLSMQSFVSAGHEFRLFAYEPIEGVPEGVVLCDAAEILPESEVNTFRCAAQFSDFFRIKLLLDRGGWFTDLDNCLLKALDQEAEYVLYSDYDQSTTTLALSKCPAGAPFLQHCYNWVAMMSVEERLALPWQAIGAEFIQGAVEFFKLTDHIAPGYWFDPLHYLRVRDLVDPVAEVDISKSYSIHLFHAAWNDGPLDRTGRGFDLGQLRGPRLDTNATYHPDSLYEKLKRKFLHGDCSIAL